ncbi:AMP-binding protein [bacterium]|nr:AMP-binding protein [bacterium]
MTQLVNMTRSELRELQWAKLQHGLARVMRSNLFYQRKYAPLGHTAGSFQSFDDFACLPFTTKEELLIDQAENPPYGSNLTEEFGSYVRLHQTSGTSGRRLRWMDTAESWNWFRECWQEIFDAVGIRPNDRFFFPFSFGPFLAFWAAFEGAIARGCFTLAGGGMTSVARLQAILDHQPTVLCATPTYVHHLIDVAREEEIDITRSSVRLLILAGEPGANIPSLRRQLESSWNARVIDHSGMTEIGSLGIEFADYPEKLFLLEDQCIAEFINPSNGEPVPAGEIGELILTNLGRWGSPLIRYRTGDMVRWRNDISPKGKPFVYLEGGILGRTDDMFYVKGNNVYPSSMEAVVRENSHIGEFSIELDDSSHPPEVTLVIEPASEDGMPEHMAATLARSFQDRLYFRPEIRIVPFGTLPRFELKARRLRRVKKSPTINP